jgi:hypothetical protein
MDGTRAAPVIHCAATHGGNGGGVSGQPVTVHGVESSTVGAPPTVTRGFDHAAAGLPPWLQSTSAEAVNRKPLIEASSQTTASAPSLTDTSGPARTIVAPLPLSIVTPLSPILIDAPDED